MCCKALWRLFRYAKTHLMKWNVLHHTNSFFVVHFTARTFGLAWHLSKLKINVELPPCDSNWSCCQLWSVIIANLVLQRDELCPSRSNKLGDGVAVALCQFVRLHLKSTSSQWQLFIKKKGMQTTSSSQALHSPPSHCSCVGICSVLVCMGVLLMSNSHAKPIIYIVTHTHTFFMKVPQSIC